MKFRLKRGRHNQGGKTYVWNNPKANIVESKLDLVAKFGSDKFERILESTPSAPETPQEPEEEEPEEENETNLDTWTVEELKAYATEQNIDLSGATKKADIIAAIELAMEG